MDGYRRVGEDQRNAQARPSACRRGAIAQPAAGAKHAEIPKGRLELDVTRNMPRELYLDDGVS